MPKRSRFCHLRPLENPSLSLDGACATGALLHWFPWLPSNCLIGLANCHYLHRKTSPYGIEPISAFYLFLIANIVAALFAPIQDCDETFNYWEPTHYLSHGYGLQTWEYSPDYAIRSWLYVGLHAIVGNLRRILPRSSKVRLHRPKCLRTDAGGALGADSA